MESTKNHEDPIHRIAIIQGTIMSYIKNENEQKLVFLNLAKIIREFYEFLSEYPITLTKKPKIVIFVQKIFDYFFTFIQKPFEEILSDYSNPKNNIPFEKIFIKLIIYA